MSHPQEVTWQLRRTRLPRALRRCAGCAAPSTFEPTGRFRVNANRRTIDVWLLLRCVACGRVLKATVLERVAVRTVGPAVLDGYLRNDPRLVDATLTDPSFRRRNRLALDFDSTWELLAEPLPPAAVNGLVTVRVELVEPLAVRPVQVVAAGLGLSRRRIERLLADGAIRASVPLDGQTTTGFGFTIDPSAARGS